jgi:hypothetical protein
MDDVPIIDPASAAAPTITSRRVGFISVTAALLENGFERPAKADATFGIAFRLERDTTEPHSE